MVAPLTGAWIETKFSAAPGRIAKAVAPLTGAWIETAMQGSLRVLGRVAPLTGAWIETF